MKAKFPNLSGQEIYHRLVVTADDKGAPGRDAEYGYGIVNPVRALTADIAPLATSASPATAATGDRERRCLAMIAYADAATDGPAGMLAVMKVVHNRIADPRFADDACAVALEPGQFQPVGEQPALRRALREPERRAPPPPGRAKLSGWPVLPRSGPRAIPRPVRSTSSTRG